MLDLAALVAAAFMTAPPAWGLATPAPEGLVEVAPEEPGERGDHVRVAFALRADVRGDEVATAWRAAFEAAGWRMIDRADDGWSLITTFERDGVRALTSLDRAGAATAQARGVIELAASPRPSSEATGPCLPIPARGFLWYVHSSAVDHHGELQRGSTRHARGSRPAVDLDGDLVLDWLVPVADPAPACPEDVRWEVWLARPTTEGVHCGRRLGVIGPGDLDAAAWRAPFDHDLRTLATERRSSRMVEREGEGPLPAIVSARRVAHFDGATYRDLGPAEESTGVCHHCATWTCSAPEALTP